LIVYVATPLVLKLPVQDEEALSGPFIVAARS